jgi:hypothetical protein
MFLKKISQPGDESEPKVPDPCVAKLDVPVYYLGANGTIPSTRGITCDRTFARVILAEVERWATRYGFGLVHLGVYNPRPARKRNGEIITPKRWSNHAFGIAIDFAGITVPANVSDENPHGFMSIDEMQAGCPAKLAELMDRVRRVIIAASRRAEIVDEGGWIHIGLWPEK